MTQRRLRPIDRHILGQMKIGFAYKANELNPRPNDLGIRECGQVLRRLAGLGYVDQIHTGENCCLWSRREKA